MSLRISSWAIERPLAPIIVFIGLLLLGLASYSKLPINNLPNVEIPIVSITINMAGAAPSEIELQITNRVEAAVASVGNIKHSWSTVTDGVSNTQIEFQLGTNLNQALTSVRDQIAEIRPLLPQNIEEPQIQRFDIDAVPMLTYTVNAPQRSLEDTSWFIDDQIVRALLAVKGVAKVERQGGLDREIRIELDPVRLQAYGVTAEAINQQLRQTALDGPAGRIDNGTQETLIRTIGGAATVDALANLSIALPGGSARLQDLGVVRDATNEARQLAWLNKKPVVTFAVYRTKSASEVSLERGVEAALAGLKLTNPGVEFTQIQSLVQFTKESYHSALLSFLEGALLAALVVFLFLRNWRATWITALEIPLSVIPTFFVMQWLGFSLNMVSMLALSLVSGILVDDAIVEIENITRHMKMGKTPYRAAMDAADEIGLAVVATTLVIVAVFVPVSFMHSAVGQYFFQFGLTVAVATLFSLVVARLITPVLAAYFLKPNKQALPHLPSWIATYRSLLEFALRRRKVMLLAAAGVLLATYAMINFIPTGFLPAEDKGQSLLQVELPPGSRLADTDKVVGQLTDILMQQPQVKTVYALVGGADSDTNVEGDVRRARLTIQLIPRKQRDMDVREFEQKVLASLARIPNARVHFVNEKGIKEVTLLLAGNDGALLQKTVMQLENEMRQLKQLANVSSTIPLPSTELVVTPRKDQAAKLGVSTEAIANTIRVATLGDLNTNLAMFNSGQRQIPIRVLLNASAKADPAVIGRLLVPAQGEAGMVPLSAVADITLGAGPTRIEHYDRQRQIALDANLNGASLGQAMDAIAQLPTMKSLPHGIKRFDTGDAELLTEMFNSFITAMLAGVLMVYAVLVLLFRTTLQPFTIMAALPLSIGGALLALLVTNSLLSLPAVIGILMLMGIVGKNGILLVDFIVEHRLAGNTRHTSIIEACQQRAQPIVMTTVAMIAGMLPVILGLGTGAAFREPMAIVVIGGLITSTALSLLFVPVIYTFVDDFEAWVRPKLKRLTTL
ncbi:MAG: efflux RND transporter permease subunit [Methylophilales bacterium]|nr:efflux RND transporter permease subunit [Methylophilales bacterium]